MAAITFPRPVSVRVSSAVWTRLSFAALMAVTFVLYVWGLDRNGWANAYYAAAVQAGTKRWKAFFFGSLDASNFITVDKSPAFLWVMEISARLFGFNQWSVLVPQALEGVATVAIVYVAVRRWFGPAAGIIAGAVVTLTPVAALMFRYNNPDALLVLLLAAAAYATLRATGSVGGIGAAGSRWGLTGWNRLFLTEFGGQISWLIPAAIILLGAGLWLTLHARRTNLARASYLMWGVSLLVTGAVFSFAQGIIHPLLLDRARSGHRRPGRRRRRRAVAAPRRPRRAPLPRGRSRGDGGLGLRPP